MRSNWIALAVFGSVLVGVVLTPTPVQSHRPITTTVMFNKEIAQIFQRKCFQCHSDNNVAMSLTTYTAARPWARAIREEVLDREMPPWPAIEGYGRFANDISLNTREKEIILSWADGGAPSGVLRAEESTPPVYVPPAPSWDHGPPDLVLPIGSGHAVASGSAFTVERFVVDTKLPAAKRVRAIALKQGDRRVVRHAAFYDEATGQWIGGWTPWQPLSQFAGGAAVALKANARLAVEIGYRGTDEDAVDHSELGLYFEDAAGPSVSATRLAAAKAPGKTGAARVRVETKLAADTQLLAFWPQPGAGARSVEITAIAPDGMSAPLLFINQYVHGWPTPFYFDVPMQLVRGTRLVMTTYADDAADQPQPMSPQVWIATAPASRPGAAPRK
jgi:hypothetical protein